MVRKAHTKRKKTPSTKRAKRVASGGPKRAKRSLKKSAKRRSAKRPAARAPKASSGTTQNASEATSGIRLNKYLADRGVASRRACDALIEEGRVWVNGESVRGLGFKIDPTNDKVEVDGVELPEVRRVYFVLNKPRGVTCNNARGLKPRAIDFLEREAERVFCVGRLDEDSEGLLILTNDGEFSQIIAHPRHQVPKTYFLKVRGPVTREELERVQRGVHLAEGRTQGARIRVQKRTQHFTYLLVTIREGRNRELRRVFARVGHPVLELKRIKIGPLTMGRLSRGSYRPLTRPEIAELRRLALEGGDSGEDDGPPRRSRKVARKGARPARRGARSS